MNSRIKAIQTSYKGYRFRSRLEARWAVFFDALSLEWEYEPEGFQLGEGAWYLPDFFLPKFASGIYFEIKPAVGGDAAKALRFAELGKKIVIAEGMPKAGPYIALPRCPQDQWRRDWFYEKYLPSGSNGRRGEQRFYTSWEGDDCQFPPGEKNTGGYSCREIS